MDLDQLHSHSINHKEELSRSKNCGCFSCRRIYPVSEIEWWIDDGQTAMCPYCDTDAVIGDACGVEITHELMEEMYKKYFEIDEEDEAYAPWHDEDGDEEWDDEEEDDDYDWEKDYYDDEEEYNQENEDNENNSKEER